MDMEWSPDGENTDYSASSSPNRRIVLQNEMDSLSDEDDFSDEFSIIDSDDEKRTDRFAQSHSLMQVRIIISGLFQFLVKKNNRAKN